MGFMRRKPGHPPSDRNSAGRRVQLHRALSKLGWGSRTAAWGWICAGEVCVDGQVVIDPLTWVDLDQQRITRQGREATPVVPLTLAMHKPAGVVTTHRDERGRRTVYDLLPPDLPWIFPAGRLDADSEGLLILTNDALLAQGLTAPEQHLPKTYHVTVRGSPSEAELQHLRDGVTLTDGMTRPTQVRLLQQWTKNALVEIILTEGRNRQIRRMWAALGYKVRRLVRVVIGNYELGDLPAGGIRQMDLEDLQRLQTTIQGTSSK